MQSNPPTTIAGKDRLVHARLGVARHRRPGWARLGWARHRRQVGASQGREGKASQAGQGEARHVRAGQGIAGTTQTATGERGINGRNSSNNMTAKQATSAGYRLLTTGYRLPDEEWMLSNIVADMQRGRVDFVLIKTSTGIEVWRRAPKSEQ